jgi:imidazole glycerol phosphate synthase glutamine amidotransferase subunit
MPDVELVDYGGGNLASMQRCLHRLDLSYDLVDGCRPPTGNRPLVLPGVGAFGAVMEALRRQGLDQRLIDLADSGTPYLGICVGLQVLLNGSQESPGVAGLGLVAGEVVRFQAPKVPQIGWNEVRSAQDSGFVYFVNSYYAVPQDPNWVWYEADYFGPFCAALRRRNLSAFQFHPEKSGAYGQSLLRRWFEEVG